MLAPMNKVFGSVTPLSNNAAIAPPSSAVLFIHVPPRFALPHPTADDEHCGTVRNKRAPPRDGSNAKAAAVAEFKLNTAPVLTAKAKPVDATAPPPTPVTEFMESLMELPIVKYGAGADGQIEERTLVVMAKMAPPVWYPK